MSQRLVAAVCYRRRNGDIEFLIVRTKGGKYWTFPKGHIKKKPAEPSQKDTSKRSQPNCRGVPRSVKLVKRRELMVQLKESRSLIMPIIKAKMLKKRWWLRS